MNRNVENHFSNVPSIDIPRSIFNRDFSHTTTFNVGDLIPLAVEEILPGDTVSVTTSKVVRLQTLLTPVMSNAYLDTYWFFVPNRLVWDHWQEFCGENTQSAWIPSTTYTMPKIKPPDDGYAVGTIADYMGIPVNVPFSPGDGATPDYRHYPTSLPFRGYALICDQFFRDENLTDPLYIPKGDEVQTGSNGSDYRTDVANGGKPFKVAKYHDYFTSALPSPQKGEQINVPLPIFPGGTYPVLTFDTDFSDVLNPNTGVHVGMKNWSSTDQIFKSDSTNPPLKYLNSPSRSQSLQYPDIVRSENEHGSNHYFDFTNLGVSIPGTSYSPLSINSLRLAFQSQRYLERLARSGSRYIELLKGFFGVTSPDARLQRAEYLGGNRVPLSVHQVTNTAQSETDFLGDLGAMSFTTDIHADFEKSFVEHGYLFCLACVRYDHLYSQGLDRMWTRNAFTDFYLPTFANIGEMPIDSSEIYCDGQPNPDVFGFQEAWAEYRYANNRISSEMRPGISGSLASWHFGDYYSEQPTLSDSWIREDKTNVDRALAVTSQVSNQILCDCYFKQIFTRPMPMYSVPGLIDHN